MRRRGRYCVRSLGLVTAPPNAYATLTGNWVKNSKSQMFFENFKTPIIIIILLPKQFLVVASSIYNLFNFSFLLIILKKISVGDSRDSLCVGVGDIVIDPRQAQLNDKLTVPQVLFDRNTLTGNWVKTQNLRIFRKFLKP